MSNFRYRGGTHENDAWRRTGYCGLGRAVDSLGLKTSKPLNIDYVVSQAKQPINHAKTHIKQSHQTSSIGSLTDDFIKAIYLASQGKYKPNQTPLSPYQTSNKKPTRRRRPNRTNPANPNHQTKNPTQRPGTGTGTQNPLPRILPIRINSKTQPRRPDGRGNDLLPIQVVREREVSAACPAGVR